ncbi:MAG: WbqC family protein [Candidatus Bipolaricaulis sp.]|nr:WbqC family protein [Salinivirgaceae bacterium]MDY0393099.1 WbqC family protein [Candidatus Bipolaricaulis sp.]
MKLAIMQPYFMPYIGYFQLINVVDKFVIYDDIEYTKKGWINRNRVLNEGKDVFITIPLEKDSDFLDIVQRRVSVSFNKRKMINQITNYYRKAPFYIEGYQLFNTIINFDETNLFSFIYNSIKEICDFLEINTPLIISSSINMNRSLKGAERVMSICKTIGAEEYINPIGGLDLYDKTEFKKNNIELFFLKTNSFNYKQFDNEFIPFLSILDVIMFNKKEQIQNYLNKYTLI